MGLVGVDKSNNNQIVQSAGRTRCASTYDDHLTKHEASFCVTLVCKISMLPSFPNTLVLLLLVASVSRRSSLHSPPPSCVCVAKRHWEGVYLQTTTVACIKRADLPPDNVQVWVRVRVNGPLIEMSNVPSTKV